MGHYALCGADDLSSSNDPKNLPPQLLGDEDSDAAMGGCELVCGIVDSNGGEMESTLEICLVGFVAACKLVDFNETVRHVV